MAHGHHHHHGNCDHAHEVQGDLVHSYSLYQKIDLINCTCLNEHEDGAGKRIFKPWEERLDVTKVMITWGYPKNCKPYLVCRE